MRHFFRFILHAHIEMWHYKNLSSVETIYNVMLLEEFPQVCFFYSGVSSKDIRLMSVRTTNIKR